MSYPTSKNLEPADERPARIGFRGIPTWEEAVGLVITKRNLESRSKHHSSGGPAKGRNDRSGRDTRGRGGRSGGKRPS